MKDIGAIMQRALDGSWARHGVLSNNVANAETPGYKRLELDFRGHLTGAVLSEKEPRKTDPRHLSGKSAEAFDIAQDLSSFSPDGNSVDIDREMGEVSTNALYYALVARQLSAHLALIRRAVTEGRR